MIKEALKQRIHMWTDKIKLQFQRVENGFSNDTKLILNALRNHDWLKDPNIPDIVQKYSNGQKFVSRKRKRNIAEGTAKKKQKISQRLNILLHR